MKSVNERQKLVARKTLPLFVRLGYEKVSFQDIATATGVPRTAIYRYYKTKREIFDAAILEIILEVRTCLARVRASRGTAAERLSQISDVTLKLLFRERDFARVVYDFINAKIASGEDMAARVSEFTIGLKHTFREVIEEGIIDGSLVKSTDAEVMSELFFSNVEVTGFKMLLGVEKTPKAGVARAEALLSLLRP